MQSSVEGLDSAVGLLAGVVGREERGYRPCQPKSAPPPDQTAPYESRRQYSSTVMTEGSYRWGDPERYISQTILERLVHCMKWLNPGLLSFWRKTCQPNCKHEVK